METKAGLSSQNEGRVRHEGGIGEDLRRLGPAWASRLSPEEEWSFPLSVGMSNFAGASVGYLDVMNLEFSC